MRDNNNNENNKYHPLNKCWNFPLHFSIGPSLYIYYLAYEFIGISVAICSALNELELFIAFYVYNR